MDRNVFVLLLSAGSGSRMKLDSKKQFLLLNDIPLFIWSTKPFLRLKTDFAIQYIMMYSPGDIDIFTSLLKKHIQEDVIYNIKLVEGGETRSHSVYNGLKSIKNIASSKDIVLIHDCARPFIQVKDILNLIESLKSHPAVTLGYSITDTLKIVNIEDNSITDHPVRDVFKGILTPQGFHFEVLFDSYERYMSSPYPVTDDTEIVHRSGYPVLIIEGEKTNIKITTQTDLILSESLFKLLNL